MAMSRCCCGPLVQEWHTLNGSPKPWSGWFILSKTGCKRPESLSWSGNVFTGKKTFDPGSRRAWPKEDNVVKSVWKSILACGVVMMAGLASAQTFTQINPPPCDFSNQFYGDNGIDTTQLVLRFGDNGGSTRLTGPPATGNQVNYVADSNCSANDPTRRDFRILATTGGNADDGHSPFTDGTPETLEFISILAFLTNQTAFETTYSRTVG